MDDTVRESEHLLRAALDGIAEGVLILDSEHCVRYVNPAATTLLDLHDLPLSAPQWRAAFDTAGIPPQDIPAAADGGPRHGHYTIRMHDQADGAVIAVEIKPLQVPLGGSLITMRSNTEIAALERELAQSREQLEITFKRGKIGLWEWDATTGMLTEYGYWVGKTAFTEHGNHVHDSVMLSHTHPDDLPRVRAALIAHMKGEADHYEVEQRVRRVDGSYMHILTCGQASQCDSAGRVLRVLGTYVDISELREQGATLRRQQHLLEVALKNARQGLWDWEPGSDRLTLSREWYALFGYQEGSIESMRCGLQELLHPDDVEPGRAALLPLLRGRRQEFEIEHRFRHVDGHYINVLSRGQVVERNDKGQAVRVIGTHVDITNLKETERRLRQSRRLLETVIDAFPLRLFWKDLDDRYLGANRLFAKDAGVADPKELVGREVQSMNWTVPLDAMYDEDERLLASGAEKIVVRRPFGTVAGNAFWVELMKVPIRGADGEVMGILGMYDDIDERIAQERQMETIAQAFTQVQGAGLLDSLSAAAAKLSGAELTFVARFDDSTLARARVTACYPHDSPLRHLAYELDGHPCARTLADDRFIVSTGVAQQFPHDHLLRESDIEAYVGQRLTAADGRVVGLFVMLFRNALADSAPIQTVIDIFSARATAELERELTHAELEASEQRLNAAIEGGGQAVWEWFPESDKMALVGSPYANLPVHTGMALYERIHPDDRPQQQRALRACFSGESNAYEYEGRILAPDGEYRWILTRGRATHFDARGRATKLIGTVTDISMFKMVQAELEQARQFLHLVINTVPQGIFWQDADFNYLGCNQQFADLAGVDSPDKLIGANDGALWWHEAAKFHQAKDRQLLEAKIDRIHAESLLRLPLGDEVWVDLTKVPMRSPDGRILGLLGAVHDVTSRRNAETAAQHLARFDPLTNLPNRRYFVERLEASMAALTRRRRKGALLFIDLDQFKHINDSLGHSVGDALLQAVAERLQHATRQEDMVARLGGDEFVVLVDEIASDLETSARHAQAVADKINESLARPYQLDRHQLHVTPTIGITLFPEAGKGVDDVLKEADTAMYSGKAAGRNVTRFFRREMEEAAQLRLSIESDLRKAIVDDEFELYFQPQVDRTGDVTGAEVLLRWHHPVRGLVPPDLFIPIAEERGLIVDIGHWILDTSFGYLQKWIEQDVAVGELAINVSSHQFRSEDFYADVERLLVRHQIPPQRVVFEITESTVVEDVEATIAIMERLRRLGIRFAIDDFGVGYSSLSYLKRLPIDQLKIDRSFITDIGKDENDEVICETIVAMSQHLRLETIAEGVESQEQYNFLMRLRCNGYQGYLFLPPSPEQTFLQYCARRPA